MTLPWAREKVVIGIDFGDEYTSAAHGDTLSYICAGITSIRLLTSWPGMSPNPNSTSRMFRTAVAYTEDGHTVAAWGNQIRSGYPAGPVYFNLKSRIAKESVEEALRAKSPGTTPKQDKRDMLDDKALSNIVKMMAGISWTEPALLNIKKHMPTSERAQRDDISNEVLHGQSPDSYGNPLSSREELLTNIRTLLQDEKLIKSSWPAGRILALMKQGVPEFLTDNNTSGPHMLEHASNGYLANHLRMKPPGSIQRDVDTRPENIKMAPAKSAIGIVTDLFRGVQKTIWAECNKVWGEEIFQTMQKELVVTVPAEWLQETKDKLLKAISRAFQLEQLSIHIATAEEVGALYVLKDNQDKGNLAIMAGDTYILMDCRQDFSVTARSYHVSQTSPALVIEQVGPVSSDQRISGQPLRDFLRWLCNWVGRERYSRIPESKLGYESQLLTQIRTLFFHFDGADDVCELRLPAELGIEDDEDLCIEDRTLELSGQRIRHILQPYLNRVFDLIKHQIDTSLVRPKGVILTGDGLHNIPHLGEQIKDYCRSLGVLPLKEPCLGYRCVDFGAVLYGLQAGVFANSMIRFSFSRRHYGLVIPGTNGEIEWLVEKGERLPKTIIVKRTIMTKRFVGSTNLTYPVEEGDDGLTMVVSGKDTTPGDLADPDVESTCKIRMTEFPLQKIDPANEFSSKWTDRQDRLVYEMAFQIRAVFSDTVSFTILHRGEALGETSLEYY
ncbi:hypothetical protein V8F33_005762 [Rhypophila sp. PSN 637]